VSEAIEFVAEASMHYGPGWPSVVLRGIDGRRMLIDNALDGSRFNVTLTPVEPKLRPCAHCNGRELLRGFDVETIRCGTCGATAPDVVTWNRREWTPGEADGI